MKSSGPARNANPGAYSQSRGFDISKNEICFVVMKKSDPHHHSSDIFWEDADIKDHCVREDAIAGKDTDVIIRIEGLRASYIRSFVRRHNMRDNVSVFDVKETRFQQWIPYSTLQRDIGYYFVKVNKVNETEVTSLFSKANDNSGEQCSVHQLHIVRGGWVLAVMSADKLHYFNDFMKKCLYSKSIRKIRTSYLLGVLQKMPRGEKDHNADVLSDIRKLIETTAKSVHPYIVSTLLEKERRGADLVTAVRSKIGHKKQIGRSKSVIYKAVDDLIDNRVVEKTKNGYRIHSSDLGSLYFFSKMA